ncbi:uncharacterized mitochondrial protein AtMg00810-like [Ziziphus jujuba]|uniref:Uncharacterized mitochondrial protein AtMg00810-like n=1 Tax=Ziziphus jujuba TaxID=326968 RepID=A0A6P6GAB7_ZIZJJ|nr:uncharacterized mitochondrial protein AtMg00810-like [Ziziphus jujuba]
MTDYEVTRIVDSEDILTHLALFSDCDPTRFDDAVKEVKWQKTKLKENGEVDKYKACLAAKGYKQEYGVDYKEVFAPVASEHKIYKLKKALRAWYSHIDAYFINKGFQRCPYEHTLYTKITVDGKIIMVCLYVDDLIYTENDRAMFEKFKESMMLEFDMTDLGLIHYFLGIEVVQSAAGIFISQKKYVQEILDRFDMKDCNSVTTPMEKGLKLIKDSGGKMVDSTFYKQIVVSLMYLTIIRPDIMHSVSLINRYMENPKQIHLLAAKRIIRYLRGTMDFGLFYKMGEKSYLYGFTDSDYAGDLDDRRSTSGYLFMMGSATVSWL